MKTPEFDLETAMAGLKDGQPLMGEKGVLAPLLKPMVEALLEGEIAAHLAVEDGSNRRNGKTHKQIKTSAGAFELSTPRDRAGTFEPQVVAKNQTRLGNEIEEKIIALYGLGNSYRDIADHLKSLYGVEVSTGTISAITDKILPLMEAWRTRPLASHYPFVWLDAIHYKIRDKGQYQTRAVYTVLALNLAGKKEVLGLYVGESEGANFWLSVLTDLNNRGVQDILIASVDGLKGFPEAIQAIFPQTEVQLCIVHQIRNSLRYVASKHHKAFMAQLKAVYRATTLSEAETALDALEAAWGERYPVVIQSWRNKWTQLSAYFRYPEPIRRVMYTTNAVEAVHRQFRKLTKSKGAFPNDNSLLKLLYLGIENASRKWTMPIQNWNLSLSQLVIFFEGRLDGVLDL